MNTNSKIKNFVARSLFAMTLLLVPVYSAKAQSGDDEFGIWGTFEFSKKINKKAKFVIDAEIRSVEAVSNVERLVVGAKLDYKIIDWLKANAGYCFIYGHTLNETSIKDIVDENLNLYDYNVDDDYWASRNRFYLSLTGECKVGRFEISLRERLQYTRTGSATTNETKYRLRLDEDDEPVFDKEGAPVYDIESGPEFKEAKNNLSLRSRLSVKYDIPKCKVTPFVSAELYTRLDKLKGYDKLRCRAGASYKINKKNSVSLYYLYQDVSGDDPDGHAIGLEYSIDL